MKNFPSEERRLTLDGYRIKFYYNQTCQFQLSPRDKVSVILKKIGAKTWKEIQSSMKSINEALKCNKSLQIREELLLLPPKDKVWTLVSVSAVCIAIAFALEIVSAYYVDNDALAFAGLGIFLLGFSILTYLLVELKFFSSIGIEKYICQESYSNALAETVFNCMTGDSDMFDNNSFRCEFKRPFLIEFCVY